uniref:Predicted protein n=1 Tax=Hordeum vulgare subsp. vulgare TaxID=112509 RepID=F2CX18_HORVV|nr:predicted protein [Hordeum vulgare subsp. vulgare]
MNFVVPDLEASQSWVIDGDTVCYDGEPIRVDVGGKILSKVLHYCKKHAYSNVCDLSAWDAEFVRGLDLETLYDLIVASDELKIEGLLALTCQTLANKIKGKSPPEICDILNIRGVFTPELHQEHSSGSCVSYTALAAVEIVANWWNLELKLVDKALRALHIVRCQEFTGYEPKVNGLVRHRFNDFNLAFFDLDKESEYFHDCPVPLDHLQPRPQQALPGTFFRWWKKRPSRAPRSPFFAGSGRNQRLACAVIVLIASFPVGINSKARRRSAFSLIHGWRSEGVATRVPSVPATRSHGAAPRAHPPAAI